MPKAGPDRRPTGKGRHVHDQQRINALGSKWDHLTALQPTYPSVVRQITQLEAAYPGIDVVMSRNDVKSALRQIWLMLQDISVFSTEVPGANYEILGSIIKMFLVLSFVFSGSPGKYQICAVASKLTYSAFRLYQASFNG